MKTLLAIRHVPFEDLGSFETCFDAAGYQIQYVDAATADFDSVVKGRWDLLVVLGGPISSNHSEHFPFLIPELRLIESRLKVAAPVLGICLGSQLLARALGAQVRRAARTEIGWQALTLTEAGAISPLNHLLGPVFHWHGETFDIPEGALHLAGTPLCPNQAFSLGATTLAIQFHPEVTARGLEQWYVGNVGELAALGLSPEILRQQAQQHAVTMASQASRFLETWLAGLPAAT
ncbi:MAG TPA: glutamine amidotransferase [Gammaproteobacteria bacterium]|nr:glutamine amidotransferase [Gammaproteobacteria bacterium]